MNRLHAVLLRTRATLVTVMTAGLVMAIWGVADDQLKQMLADALDSVKN